jgi:hypothetical protein
MKVLTKYPVYINKKKISNADFYYNADDTLPTDPFSYADEAGKAAAITAGVGAAATLGAALASRQKAPLSEVENKCGKRPKIGKKKKAQWQECANKFSSSESQNRMINPALIPSLPSTPVTPVATTTDTNKNKMLYVGLGVVALAVVGYFVYKSRTKTATA